MIDGAGATLRCRHHGLPDSIQPLHRAGPAEALGLLLDQQLSIVVRHHAGFTNQSLVLQLTACDLLVQTLQAHQEHAVPEPMRQKYVGV